MPFSNYFLLLQTTRKKIKFFFSASFSRLLGPCVYRAFHVSFAGVGDWYPDTELAAFGLDIFKNCRLPCLPHMFHLYIENKEKEGRCTRETRCWVKWKFVSWFMYYVYGFFGKSCRAMWIKHLFGKLIIVHVEYNFSFVIVVFALRFNILGCLLVRWLTSLIDIQEGAYQWLQGLQYS